MRWKVIWIRIRLIWHLIEKSMLPIGVPAFPNPRATFLALSQLGKATVIIVRRQGS